MMLRVHILSKELTYIKLKIVLCSLQDIHELMNFSCQPPTLDYYSKHHFLEQILQNFANQRSNGKDELKIKIEGGMVTNIIYQDRDIDISYKNIKFESSYQFSSFEKFL